MVIMTVAMVSMAELMAITLRLQMLGRNQTAAARLAQDKIDELMTQNFNTAATVAIGGSLDGGCREPLRYPTDGRHSTRAAGSVVRRDRSIHPSPPTASGF